MLKGRQYESLLPELRTSRPTCSYPILYLDQGEVRLGGLFDVEESRGHFSAKRFELPRYGMSGIEIEDLVGVDMLFPHPDGYYDTYSQKLILEPEEVDDVFVFAARAKREHWGNPDYYRKFDWVPTQPATDGYRVLDAELFDLAIFHGTELIHEVRDVFRGFKIGRNVQVVYVKPNPQFAGSYLELSSEVPRTSQPECIEASPYEYWLYRDGASARIGTGWDRDPRFIPTERESAVYGIGLQPTITRPVVSTDGTSITVRYHFEPTPMFELLDHYAREKGVVTAAKNFFGGDTTPNYEMVMPVDHVNALAFIEFIFNHSPSLAGEALFWADLDDYYCGTSCLDTTLRLLNAAPRTRDAHRNLLSRLFDECGEPYDEMRLPSKVTDNVLSGAAHIAAVRAYVEANHPVISSWKRARQGRDLDEAAAAAAESYFAERKQEYEERKTVATATFRGSKWTSERTLFEMTKSYYPDAIFQFRAEWLGLQSLDIYIPGIRVALEYQGRQHYKSVDHFGGDVGLEDVQVRDRIKSEACEGQGIRIVEWPYWEPLSALTLRDKLR